MNSIAKISLNVPSEKNHNRYFSFKLKRALNNEPSVFLRKKKLFAVSDIEGQFEILCRILIKNKVINKRFEWTFEDNHLVIVGDCFDRGEYVTECLWLIYSLEEKALKQGGHVHFILGNHEIMNFNGDWRYVHPKYAQHTKSPMPHTALYDGNSELWRWLRTKNIIEKIGDILFVHGGITDKLLQFELSIQEINEKAKALYTNSIQLTQEPFLSILNDSNHSPFWYRGYYNGTASHELIDTTLRRFGVNTIVTGHTITDQVRSYFDGKVINVNTNHAAGISEGLLIKSNKFYRISANGIKEKIK